MFMRVDLPDPEGPMIETYSLRRISMSTPRERVHDLGPPSRSPLRRSRVTIIGCPWPFSWAWPSSLIIRLPPLPSLSSAAASLAARSILIRLPSSSSRIAWNEPDTIVVPTSIPEMTSK